MTRLLDIGDIRHLISGSAIERLPIWIVPVAEVTRLALKNLVAQIGQKLPNQEGRKLVRQIASELYKSRALGLIPACAATMPESFQPRLDRQDIREMIGKFSPLERRLIVFAMLTDENIAMAAMTTHANLRQRGWTGGLAKKALKIARRAPRHIGSDLVFWEHDPQQKPKALHDIGSKFRRATKMQWGVFSELARETLKPASRQPSD